MRGFPKSEAQRLKRGKKPIVLLTTSRRPTRSIRTFCSDLSRTFPNIVHVNRGKLSLEGVAEKALELEAEGVMIVDRWKGGPGKVQLFKVEEGGLKAFPLLIYLKGVKLRRDFKGLPSTIRRAKSVAIVRQPETPSEIEKLENAFSKFFNVPVFSIEEAVKRNCDIVMQTSVDQANRATITFKLVPELAEVGPKLKISHLIWG